MLFAFARLPLSFFKRWIMQSICMHSLLLLVCHFRPLRGGLCSLSVYTFCFCSYTVFGLKNMDFRGNYLLLSRYIRDAFSFSLYSLVLDSKDYLKSCVCRHLKPLSRDPAVLHTRVVTKTSV